MMEEKDMHAHHHEHEHLHEHAHVHEHGHDHEHEHEHHHDGPLSISEHEGALIGAMKGVMKISDPEEAEKLLSGQMKEASARITEKGGIVGHIKFILSSVGKCSQISVTDLEENIRHFDGNCTNAEGVAIVFLIGEEELEEILLSTVGTLFS